MRTSTILASLVGGIIALVAAALLAVGLWVHPNDYKAKIGAAVEQSTGRELVLTGDIRLSVFPWVALELGPASLKNPPGFGEEPFLSFNHATVRVRWWALMARRLEIARVELDGVDVRLLRNANGRGNWEGFGPRSEEGDPSDANAGVDGKTADGKTSAQGNVRLGVPALGGIRVTHGRISYPGFVVENFKLETGALGEHDMTPVNLIFTARRGVPNENLTVDARFVVGAVSSRHQLRLAAVNVSGLLARPGDARPAHWGMSAPTMELDLYLHTLAVQEFHVGYSNAHLTGKLLATKSLDQWGATGSLTLAPFDLREFAPRRMALPRTRDPRVFAQLSATSDFSVGPGGLRLDPLKLQLDDTHVTGHIAVVGEPRTLQIELAADQIDLDRYRGEEGSAEAEAQPKAGTVAAAGDSEAAADTAKPLDADGAISIGSAHVASMDFTPVHLTFAARDGVLRVFPVRALIDGGRYSGDITVDRRGAIPAVAVDEHFIGIDMKRLLAKGAYPGRLSGHGNLDLKATAQGAGLAPLLQSMNGHFDADLTEGAIEGVDVGYELARAKALINHEPAPARENTRRTTFDAFKVSAEIVNGVATSKDLLISSEAMRVTGQGSTNLSSKAIDVQLLASILKSPTATLADIPLKISGTYADPTVKADVNAAVKGELKQKLKDVLKKNGLDGLFGK